MKYFVVAFAVFVVAVSGAAHNKEAIKKLGEECIAESGVHEDVVKQARKGHSVEDEKLDHYASCVLRKLDLEDAHGKIIVDGAKAKLPDDISETHKDNFVNTCLHKKGPTDLKTSFEVWQCYHELSHS